MKILPIERYSIESKKSANEIYIAIDKDIEPHRLFLFRYGIPESLVGKREENEFELRRSIQGRNSFLPIALGEISDCESGAKIKITLQLHFSSIIVALFIVSYCLSVWFQLETSKMVLFL